MQSTRAVLLVKRCWLSCLFYQAYQWFVLHEPPWFIVWVLTQYSAITLRDSRRIHPERICVRLLPGNVDSYL
jgi:hypothetical protein